MSTDAGRHSPTIIALISEELFKLFRFAECGQNSNSISVDHILPGNFK